MAGKLLQVYGKSKLCARVTLDGYVSFVAQPNLCGPKACWSVYAFDLASKQMRVARYGWNLQVGKFVQSSCRNRHLP
jgi:hypothetical protein